MKKTISIRGPIGSFMYKGKPVNGVQLIDLISAVTSEPDLTELIVEIGSPGGSVPVAKAMRGFLKSIQPRIMVTTKQVDDIASSGTILFSSGSKRQAAKGINPATGNKYQFMVHYPWVPHTEGNADDLENEARGLRMAEDEMVSIYQEDTGISKEAIQPLMKAETFFDSDQAMNLKFATETYEGSNIAAYMKPEEKESLVDELLAFLKGDKKKATTVATAPPAELMGKAVLVDGKAPVDGIYTVVGGVITALGSTEQAAPVAAPVQSAPVATDSKKLDEVLAAIKLQPNPEVLIAAVNKLVDEKLVAMKKTITTSHVPEGFTPETSADDIKEWDRSFKANEHVAMKKNDPEKYKRIFYAKYGRIPN